MLHSGLNLLPNLYDIICRWRQYECVFVSNIEKMYRQIRIHPDNYKQQFILWRRDPKDPVWIYRLITATYGMISSTFLACRTVRQLAQDKFLVPPLGDDVLRAEVYMDKVLSGGHTLADTLSKQKELIQITNEGGFPLRKFSTKCHTKCSINEGCEWTSGGTRLEYCKAIF